MLHEEPAFRASAVFIIPSRLKHRIQIIPLTKRKNPQHEATQHSIPNTDLLKNELYQDNQPLLICGAHTDKLDA